jgi:hypothetical protein
MRSSMFMDSTMIILCDTFNDAVILNNTNRIMKTRYRAQHLLVLISGLSKKNLLSLFNITAFR